jgi:regulator of sirC expression with transglutaminase-like and TPR domain
MAPPDLGDPAERAAYHRELRGVGVGLRRAGIAVALAGALLVLAHRHGVEAIPLWLGVSVLGVGVLVMVAAVSTRTAYHRLRMRN